MIEDRVKRLESGGQTAAFADKGSSKYATASVRAVGDIKVTTSSPVAGVVDVVLQWTDVPGIEGYQIWMTKDRMTPTMIAEVAQSPALVTVTKSTWATNAVFTIVNRLPNGATTPLDLSPSVIVVL